jgi:hypothetical protein
VQVLIGHNQLGQLPVEPRDLLVPELNGRLRLLKRGALPLELALRFFPGRAFTLKGGLSILLGGLLLLEPGLCFLARTLLLLELLPRCGKRGDLVRQVGPQLLDLLGLLLGQALPRPRPLEWRGPVGAELAPRRAPYPFQLP